MITETIADAFDYIRNEWVLEDGRIEAEQWAEGFAFSRVGQADQSAHVAAKELRLQLTPQQWDALIARGDHMRLTDGYAFCGY